jgi:hypothetical protein
MSTNFLQHNPTEANQDTDGQYLVDNSRTAGLGVDQIVPSIWMNKVLYQVSTFVAAFAQTLSNKGYNCSDADINALEAVLANVITNADTKPGFITVPFSSSPVFNAALANGFRFTLNANVTSSTLTNIGFGQILTFIIQDTGNFSFVWPTNVLGAYDLGPNGSTPSSVNTQQFVVLEDNNAYPITSMVNRLRDQIASFQPQINAINGTLGTLQSEINTTNGNVSSVQNQVNTINGSTVPNLQSQINSLNSNKQNNLGFTPVQQGGGAGQGTNKVLMGWSGSRVKVQIDSTDQGNVVFDGNMTAYVASVISSLFAGSLAANGWIALGSLIVQWASGTTDSGQNVPGQTINFPRQFPNAIFGVVPSTIYTAGNSDTNIFVYVVNGTPNTSSVNIYRQRRGDQSNATTYPFIIALGI